MMGDSIKYKLQERYFYFSLKNQNSEFSFLKFCSITTKDLHSILAIFEEYFELMIP